MINTANALMCCPDRPGIINKVTDFLFFYGANISILEQHIEGNHFFMRVEWELDNFQIKSKEEFENKFEKIKKELFMDISLDFRITKKRIGLFCSKELHCLIDILSKYIIGELDVEIAYVISNSLDGKELVEKFDIPFYYTETKKDSSEHEEIQLEIIKNNPTDFIGLARYMKILSQDFVEGVNQKIINVHHSFLPSFIGARPYDEAHERGVKLIGATSHYVIPELDRGPIIEQSIKRIKHNHSIDKLKVIGRECEKEVFSEAIKKHLENKLIIYKNRTIVFE